MNLDPGFWSAVLESAVRLSTPVGLAALGGLFVQKAGRLNLGIEGMVVVGSFVGAWTSYHLGWVGGVVAGALGGTLLAVVMALIIARGANEVVVGVAITTLGIGVATFAFKLWVPPNALIPSVPTVPRVRLGWLADLPFVGPVLFHQSWLTYLFALAVPLTRWTLHRSRFGLAVRAVGDDAHAAATRGLRPARVHLAALSVGGFAAGLAGAALTVGYLGAYVDGVSGGRGYIALAVVVMAGGSVWGVLGGALLFATFEALALLSQGSSLLASEAWHALPYTVTLVVLAVTLWLARRRSVIHSPTNPEHP